MTIHLSSKLKPKRRFGSMHSGKVLKPSAIPLSKFSVCLTKTHHQAQTKHQLQHHQLLKHKQHQLQHLLQNQYQKLHQLMIRFQPILPPMLLNQNNQEVINLRKKVKQDQVQKHHQKKKVKQDQLQKHHQKKKVKQDQLQRKKKVKQDQLQQLLNQMCKQKLCSQQKKRKEKRQNHKILINKQGLKQKRKLKSV